VVCKLRLFAEETQCLYIQHSSMDGGHWGHTSIEAAILLTISTSAQQPVSFPFLFRREGNQRSHNSAISSTSATKFEEMHWSVRLLPSDHNGGNLIID
jgi:hypothetical protein